MFWTGPDEVAPIDEAWARRATSGWRDVVEHFGTGFDIEALDGIVDEWSVA